MIQFNPQLQREDAPRFAVERCQLCCQKPKAWKTQAVLRVRLTKFHIDFLLLVWARSKTREVTAMPGFYTEPNSLHQTDSRFALRTCSLEGISQRICMKFKLEPKPGNRNVTLSFQQSIFSLLQPHSMPSQGLCCWDSLQQACSSVDEDTLPRTARKLPLTHRLQISFC